MTRTSCATARWRPSSAGSAPRPRSAPSSAPSPGENVRQLGRAHRGLTAALAADPRLLPGRDELAFIDIDSTQERVYGYQKEGAAFGHAKVQGKSLLLKGLNPLISVISTPLAAPVLGPVRLRAAAPARRAAPPAWPPRRSALPAKRTAPGRSTPRSITRQ